MSPLSEISNNLLRISSGDVAAFEQVTTQFVDTIRSAPAADFALPAATASPLAALVAANPPAAVPDTTPDR